jgi:hypothetical protein
MRNFILGALCALSISVFAVTVNPDGSETYTHEEAGNILENFNNLEAENARLNGELAKANIYFKIMEKKMAECQAKIGKPV